MTRARALRWAWVAAPFLLLALGTWALVSSPWPAIVGLMLRGRHVYVAGGWRTTALGVAGVGSYVAALLVSYTIRLTPRAGAPAHVPKPARLRRRAAGRPPGPR